MGDFRNLIKPVHNSNSLGALEDGWVMWVHVKRETTRIFKATLWGSPGLPFFLPWSHTHFWAAYVVKTRGTLPLKFMGTLCLNRLWGTPAIHKWLSTEMQTKPSAGCTVRAHLFIHLFVYCPPCDLFSQIVVTQRKTFQQCPSAHINLYFFLFHITLFLI